MKINESQGTVLPQAARPVSQKEIQGNEFQKMMEQTISERDRKLEAPRADHPAPVPEGIQIQWGAAAVEGTATTVADRQVVEALQSTLDLVDLYAARLADSSAPASQLSPLIGHLEEKMETLGYLESYPDLPGSLRPVVSDLLVTIGTEIAKFRRGDYA